jgi:hypothetical protein
MGLAATRPGKDNGNVTKEDLIKKLKDLSEDHFARVAPFLEADLEAVDDLAILHQEIEAGRRSAAKEPILEAKDVYARVRQALSE